ncbi:P-loop containing nucleoside triphosphate hydrolase [Lasallia pustulata]|uniref:p-loop containing nucleoside triphosphate hydrolase n=1 Tax=Lasallia pustulata TaxID=136370 RepID=A0A1W5CYQ1_9LECA|nr:P-loop containing nucleoside triphosphate hydrolase [Lasallia pustulata]
MMPLAQRKPQGTSTPTDMDPFTFVSNPETVDQVYTDFERHSNAHRVDTDATLASSIRARHPDMVLTIASYYSCDLLAFAAAGHAETEQDPSDTGSLTLRHYDGPPNRLDGGRGTLSDEIKFAKFLYRWHKHDFVLYFVEGDESSDGRIKSSKSYVLQRPEGDETVRSKGAATDQLISAAAEWGLQLHDEILVYDSYWRKDANLWKSVQNADWNDIILNEEMKHEVIRDVEGFFDERTVYKEFSIPWKRGIIFHGPPGNGKTISLKALMKSLYDRSDPVPTLYVKSIPQLWSISAIFTKARATAPCLLVFEDLDTLVTPYFRSYFLNEVDGLESNDGILMIGSTNYLAKLDPGLAKRPSRFDRKYYFPLPVMAERVQYCEYWRHKLQSNPKVEFPERLSSAIADITDGFSFAYMKEAFVSALLLLVVDRKDSKRNERIQDGGQDGPDELISRHKPKYGIAGGGDDNLEELILWRTIKRQIRILREELDEAEGLPSRSEEPTMQERQDR